MKFSFLSLLLSVSLSYGASGLGQTPLSPVISTPNTVSVGGNTAAINSTLASVQSGDTVIVQAGTYYISNNTPVIIPTGVTLQGVYSKTIFVVDTNGPDAGRLDYSTFQAKDNSVIRNITWLATNGWNTTTTLGAYASFLRSGPTYTNVLVDHCDLQGGSDVFYSTNGAGLSQTIVQSCKLTSLWDFNSGGSGNIITIGSSWTGLGDVTRASRIALSGVRLLDYGSTLNGFAGFDTAASSGPWGFHGTVLNFSPSEANVFNSTRTDLTGDYVDTVKGFSYSLTAERASYITNGFSTNITYSMTLTNIKVISTSGDAKKTGTYLLGATDGNFTSGQSFFTNQSQPTVVLWLNDPAGVVLEGGNNTFTIRTNFGAGVIIALGQWNDFANLLNNTAVPENTVTTSQPFSLADGDQAATVAEFTNSITTNIVGNLQPSIFQGKVSWVSNAVFQVPNIASQKTPATASSAISFPNTTVNWTNTQGFNIILYIDNAGVTGTLTKKNGQQIYSALVGDVVLLLKPGDYFSETYTVGTPSARWEPQ